MYVEVLDKFGYNVSHQLWQGVLHLSAAVSVSGGVGTTMSGGGETGGGAGAGVGTGVGGGCQTCKEAVKAALEQLIVCFPICVILNFYL